jgi:hypothetical protein
MCLLDILTGQFLIFANQELRRKQTEYEIAFFYQPLTPQVPGNLPLKRLKLLDS